MIPAFAPNDRVLIVAPHPDDESLAAGGLIQRITKSGAAGRVLMLTNGDNNPWPQRWLEKRWRIGPGERQRWGAMRMEEALAALEKLGFNGDTRFLGFPDQEMTEALLKNDPAMMAALCECLGQWRPTFLVFPSTYDLHPDHNALHVLIQIALNRLGLEGLPQLHYAVHCKRRDLVPNPVTLPLDAAERSRKNDAILCHKSQMILSRERFLAYAQPEEGFFEPAPVRPAMPRHAVAEARVEDGKLRLGVRLPFCRRGVLWLAGETACGRCVRWEFPMPFTTGKVPVTDLLSGEPVAEASARVSAPVMRFRVPLEAAGKLTLLYIKYHRPSIFLDHSGWRQVPLEANGSAL